MATVRLGQLSGETRNTDDFSVAISNAYSISTTFVKTGSYAYRGQPTSDPCGIEFNSTTQLQSGVWLRHNGFSTSTGKAWLLSFRVDSNPLADWCFVHWNKSNARLEMYVDGSIVDSVLVADTLLNSTATWLHLGCTIKFHATNGFFSLYVNGEKALHYTGSITGSSTGAFFGGRVSSGENSLGSYHYYDDFYVDDRTGESDGSVLKKRFFCVTPYQEQVTEFTVTGAVDNVTAISDFPHDGLTTYNESNLSDQRDTFTFTPFVLPTLHVIRAVIPTVIAKTTNAEYPMNVKLLAFDGASYVESAENALGLDFSSCFCRLPTQNDNTAWGVEDLTMYQFGYKSSGE